MDTTQQEPAHGVYVNIAWSYKKSTGEIEPSVAMTDEEMASYPELWCELVEEAKQNNATIPGAPEPFITRTFVEIPDQYPLAVDTPKR